VSAGGPSGAQRAQSRDTALRVHLRKTKIAFVTGLLALVALGGCGDLGQLSGRVEQPQLVTKGDLAEYPADSPQHTALAWWRALQFGSPELAAGYYSDSSKVTPASLDRQLRVGPELLDLRARLRVVDVIRRGDRASVLAMRTRVLQYPNGRTDRVRIPQTINLRRESGHWRLTDNRYIERTLSKIEAFVKKGTALTAKKQTRAVDQRAP
jgi:hypothetical protein